MECGPFDFGYMVSAIENMIVDRADALEAPAGRNMAGVKEQRTFNGAFPLAVECNLADRNGIAPVQAASIDAGHLTAAHE